MLQASSRHKAFFATVILLYITKRQGRKNKSAASARLYIFALPFDCAAGNAFYIILLYF